MSTTTTTTRSITDLNRTLCKTHSIYLSIANMFTTQQDIVNWKTALQTATSQYVINLVYFSPKTAKNGTGVLTHPQSIIAVIVGLSPVF